MSKAARWLDLIAYLLQHRFPVTREDIYQHVADYKADSDAAGGDEGALESLRRKFERDKDELRALGITIETVELPHAAGDEAAVGYRLRERDFYLPYLEAGSGRAGEQPYAALRHIRLEQDDISRLDRASRRVMESSVPALAQAAASARRKLEFDLTLPLHAIERVLSRPVTGEGAKALEVLQRAVEDRIAVRCRYFAIGRDQEEERVIEPYALFFGWGRWYAIALSRERGAMRVFRVDRMKGAELLKGREARFEVPRDFRVRDYIRRAPWELTDAEPVTVRVRFGFPESRWVLAQGVGDPVDDMLEDGSAIVAFAVRERASFLRWLLTHRTAHVEEPAEVAVELAALRRKVAALYAAAGGGGASAGVGAGAGA